MRHLLAILLATLCATTGYAQTIKVLGYTTNGQIVAATNVVWTNAFSFSTNTVAAQVRTNAGLGWPALTNSNAATTLLGFTTNNQVVTGTDALTFTNELVLPSDANHSGTTQLAMRIGASNTGFYVSTSAGNPMLAAHNSAAAFALTTNVIIFYKPLRYNSTTTGSTNAPANATNAATWLEVQIGTNSYRVPLYQ